MLYINGVLLTLSAVFIYDWRSQLMLLLMLFLPFIDNRWLVPDFNLYKPGATYVNALKALLAILLLVLMSHAYVDAVLVLTTLILVALPEEWFFRAYFQQIVTSRIIELLSAKGQVSRLYPLHAANVITSVFFALLHLPIQGVRGGLVFFPSLLFGFVYQKTNDLVLLVLLHAVSNILYLIVLNEFMS